MRLTKTTLFQNFVISLIFLVSGFSPLFAQIVLLDQDHNPIHDVMVYPSTNSLDFVISDEEGTVQFHENWDKQDTLIFTHIFYKNIRRNFSTFNKYKTTIIILKEDLELLEEIVVSTNVNEDNLRKRAERSILISKREIERLNPQTTADLLSHKAGVLVQKSQQGGGSPNIRGFEANRILLVIDGIRMNNAIYRGGHLQNAVSIDPAILNNSEILFGPSSVTYGSDAMGGVVHFRTRIPQFNQGVKYNYSSTYSSANKGLVNHIDVSFGNEKWAFLSSMTKSDFKDLRMGANRSHGYDNWGIVTKYWDNGFRDNTDKNIQKRTGYDQTDLLQKVVYKVNDNSKLIGNFQYSLSSRINRFDQLNDEIHDGTLKYQEWYYGPQKRTLNSISFLETKERLLFDRMEIITAYQKLGESRHSKKTSNDYQTNRFEEVEVASLNANFRKQKLDYGLEIISNNVNSKANQYFTENDSTAEYFVTRYPRNKAKMKTYAAYSKYGHTFNDRWNANLGVRYTHTDMEVAYDFEGDFFKLDTTGYGIKNNALNFNASLVFHPTPTWKIAGIFSTGFHVPNIDDVSKIYEKGKNTVIPNFDLDTEYSKNLELSISKNIQNKHLLSLNMYYSILDNPIVKVDDYIVPEEFIDLGLGNIQSNINEDRAYITGVTASIASKLSSSFKLVADITYTKGEITDRHDDYEPIEGIENENDTTSLVLAHIPPLFGKVMLSYNNSRWTNSFSIVFNGPKDPKDFDNAGVDNLDETPIEIVDGIIDEKGTPAWYTLNLKSSYQLNDNLTIQAGLDNILDQHYKTAGSGLSAAGRNFILSVRAKF